MKKCLRCGKSFRPSNFKRHMKRVKLCKKNLLDVSYKEIEQSYESLLVIAKSLDTGHKYFEKTEKNEIPLITDRIDKEKDQKSPEIKCRFCFKTFKHKNNLYRHQKHRCKEKNKMINFEEDTKTPTNNYYIYNTTNNYIQNNITQNVIVNNYGTEDTSYITNRILQKLINIPFSSIQQTNKMIHFNKKHPENMNIKIKDVSEPYVDVYDKDKWCVKDKKKIIKELIGKAMKLVDEYYEGIGKYKLPNAKNTNYIRFQEAFNKDLEFQKRLEEEIETMIINSGLGKL